MTEPTLKSSPESRLGPVAFALVVAGYLVALLVATYPALTEIGRTIPGGRTDPSTHLWILRWYERCALEGKSPFFASGVNYPVGVALGQDPPMHLQSALFIALRAFTTDDVLRFGLIWTFGLLTSAVGTFWLAWTVTRNRLASWLAGLLTMLGGPLLLHAHGHLELIYLGGFPIFLWAWLRWLDQPGAGRMFTAVGAYLLLATCAHYYGVMAVVPAIFTLAIAAAKDGRRGVRPFLRRRLPGLLAFGMLSLFGMVLLYAPHLWTILQGVPLERAVDDFESYRTPWWGYFVPIPYLRLGPFIASRFYQPDQLMRAVEIGSYLGVVTLGLLAASLFVTTRLDRKRTWWSLLVLFVVLSFGSHWMIGSTRVSLPAEWLRATFPPMRLTRVPARFNLFALVIASVLAAATLKSLLDRLPRRWLALPVISGLTALAILDLGLNPFPRSEIPHVPPAYARIRQLNPGATLLEVPQFDPFGGPEAQELDAIAGYWQAEHGLRTVAGYTAIINPTFSLAVSHPSPFADRQVRRAEYGTKDALEEVDLARNVPMDDSLWLFLDAHDIDYLVVHRWFAVEHPIYQEPLGNLIRRIKQAEVIEDRWVSIFDRRKLPAPTHPVALPIAGWSARLPIPGPDRRTAGLEPEGKLAAYVPEGTEDLELVVEAISRARPRPMELLADGEVIARWIVHPRAFTLHQSPPFRLPPGRHELTLRSVAESEQDLEDLSKGRSPIRVAAFVFRSVRTDIRTIAGGSSSLDPIGASPRPL